MDFMKEFYRVNNGIIETKLKRLKARKLVEEEIAFREGSKIATVFEDFESVLETNPQMYKDVHMFDTIFEFDRIEKQLKAGGISMSYELSSFMKNSQFLGKEEALKIADFPKFHFILEGKYRDQFWRCKWYSGLR